MQVPCPTAGGDSCQKHLMNRFFLYSPLVLQTAIWPIVRPLFRFFLHLKISGLENLKSAYNYGRTYAIKKGVIFAVNHSSELDAVLVPASLPFLSPLMPMFYTSREQAFYRQSGWRQILYGGFLFKLWGSHALHSGKKDYEVSLQTHIKILEKGRSICIFPDGKRLPESDIGTIAHGGIGYLAWRTKAPIVPVRISGAYRITPADFFLRRRSVSVAFGRSLSPAEIFGENAAKPTPEVCKDAARRVMERIRGMPKMW